MSDMDFEAFVDHYRVLRLGAMEFSFVVLWRPKIERFHIDDLLGAVNDLAADRRVSFPLNDLPILIEHAETRKERRERSERKPMEWGPPPPSCEAWNAKMLAIGAINKKEFNRRQAECKGGAA